MDIYDRALLAGMIAIMVICLVGLCLENRNGGER